MKLTAIAAAVLAVAVISVADSPTASAEAASDNRRSSRHVVIMKGDSLSKIAKAEDSTYKRLFYANTYIKDPDLIYPGDKVRIPHENEKLKQRSLPTKASAQQVSKPQRTQASAVSASKVSTPKPTQLTSKPAPKPAGVVNGSVWDRLAQCEASGNWGINTGNGYYGGLQFTLSSWRAVGGSGYPHQASKSEQIARAEKLLAIQGWGAWPACSAKLGLR